MGSQKRISSLGSPFTVWGPVGMPRINDQMLNCVFYLYRDKNAADKGEHAGGTGFWVGYQPESSVDSFYIFAVSNKHVVADAGASVIRVNTIDGNVDVLELEPHEWYFNNKDDLAITNIHIDTSKQKINFIPISMFVTGDIVEKHDLGPGDEVFMIGRFVRHDGKTTNVPSVRFGNLSIPESMIDHPIYNTQESFAVEMRSMAGYSGSPVFIYPSEWNMNRSAHAIGCTPLYLLGVDWGHIVDQLEVIETKATAVIKSSGYVRASTGMNGVVPAWRLSDLIKTSPWAEHMKREATAAALKKAADGPSTVVDVAPVDGVNPNHREAFTSLLDEAAKKKPQGG
jgi:hypothetical protein